MPTPNTCKLGRDLIPGDVLIYGTIPYTIASLDSHPGLDIDGRLYAARIAVCTERFAITVFDEDPIPVLAFGTKPGRN